MNSNLNLYNESIQKQSNDINSNIIQNSEIINSAPFPINNSSISKSLEEKKELFKNNKAMIAKDEEKISNSNASPLKPIIGEQNAIIEGTNISINSSKNISSNQFINQINEEPLNKNNTIILNEEENTNDNNKNFKKNKSQFVRNSINVNPEELNKISNEINNGVIRIKIYKSHIKKRRTAQYNKIYLSKENEKITNNKKVNNSEISDFNDKKYKYKLLIKRLARQLKTKIKPPTKGYFYLSIIRTDKYFDKVKKIAKKLKICVHPPDISSVFAPSNFKFEIM